MVPEVRTVGDVSIVDLKGRVTHGSGDLEMRETVRACGRAWVACATFEGREVLRVCATHGETSLADVDELVAALTAAV